MIAIFVKNFSDQHATRENGGGPKLDKAPNFILNTVDGGQVELAELKGKGVLINFWGSWCGPCKNEMPAIQSAYDTYKDQGFEVLAINLGEKEEKINRYLEEMPSLSFPILLDDNKVSSDYQMYSLPTSYFVNPDGTLQHMQIGELSEEELHVFIQEILPSDD